MAKYSFTVNANPTTFPNGAITIQADTMSQFRTALLAALAAQTTTPAAQVALLNAATADMQS